MPRRVKQKKSIFSELSENFFKKISTEDKRLRRKIVKISFWAISLFFVYSMLHSTYGIKRIITLHLEKETLVEMNRDEYIKLIDGQRLKGLLQHDRDYIEYIARTEYHMVYPNEMIYRYRGQ